MTCNDSRAPLQSELDTSKANGAARMLLEFGLVNAASCQANMPRDLDMTATYAELNAAFP